MKQTNNFTQRRVAAVAVLITILWFGAVTAFAQTRAFTYQGRFTDSSAAQPTNGTYTMTFRLFDAANGGNQIPDNSTVVTSMVTVTNGIFTTRLDFGAAAFNTAEARFLEIQVGSTVLTPRQEITSTPFSLRALNAANADSLSANCVGCVTNAQINTVDGTKITGSVTNAALAQNSQQLGGVTANNFVQLDSSLFIRNQTTAQTANLNITGAGSVGGNFGIGTTATTTEVLRVVGNTTGNGFSGEGILLQAGNGFTNGTNYGGGGSITLQPGSGAVGQSVSAPDGNVLLTPNSGNVGIGTTNPTSKLFVNGDLTVTGAINGTLGSPLGQEATTVYGTGGLTVTRTNQTYLLIPGLTQTINVPENTVPRIIISTDGGIRSNSTTGDGRSIVDVAIYLDGALISSRQHHLSNASIAPAVENWALSIAQLLTPGSHTIEVRARSTSESFLSNATISGGASDNVLRGQLTIATIKR